MVSVSTDDPHQEEQQHYRRKMGRWRRDSGRNVRDECFWHVINILSSTLAPIEHLINAVHSRDEPFVYASLVCGKADSIAAECGKLLEPACWVHDLYDCASLDLTTTPEGEDDLHDLVVLGIELTLCHHGGLIRRVIMPLTTFPNRALRVAHSPADVPCEMRQQTAKEIMQSVEPNMVKLKALCNAELKAAARDGLCGPLLFSITRGWYEGACDGTVERNETHNSYIRKECTKCRNIGLDTLSSRCNGKAEIGYGSGKKWSVRRPKARALLQEWSAP
jgi:hypothetical protein